MATYVGVDYSVTSPSVTVISDVLGRRTVSVSTVKKHLGDHLVGDVLWRVLPYPDWSTPQERYHRLAETVFTEVEEEEVDRAVFEDYAMAASGRVFHIAEATQVLKSMFWARGVTPEAVAPTALKKFATGSGNARKWRMREALADTHDLDFHGVLGQTRKDDASPSSDAVDSFWAALYAAA